MDHADIFERKIEREEVLSKDPRSRQSIFLADYKNQLAEQITDDMHIYTIRSDKYTIMYVYDNGIYKPEGGTYVREWFTLNISPPQTSNFINQVLDIICSKTYIEEEKFFEIQNKDEIAVRNGILNVRKRTLRAFEPKSIFFHKIPVDYSPEHQPKEVVEFIKSIIEHEEDISVIQELIGYCLYRDYGIEKAWMFLGKGRNGKGQLLELIKVFLGEKNCAGMTLQRLCDDNSFSISELHGKLVNLGGDVSKRGLKDTGVFKSITGNDLVSAKRKFLSDIAFRNYAKLVFCCNKLPKTHDNSDGYWDRWGLLNFPYQFVHREVYENTPLEKRGMMKIRKNNIINQITSEEELSGLLNWSLDGLKRLLEQGHYTFSPATKNVKDRWIKQADSFAAFCYDFLEEGDYEDRVSKGEIRKSYSEYCKRNNLDPENDTHIKNHLGKEFGSRSNRLRTTTKDISYWTRIKFAKGSKDSDGFSTYNKIHVFTIETNNPRSPRKVRQTEET